MFVAQGSSTRAANSSVRPDLQSLGISLQQSMLANTFSSHPMHSSAPAISTAGVHWSGEGNVPVSGYSWMSQTLSAGHPDTTSHGIMEGRSQLSRPTTVGSAMQVENPVRQAGLAKSEVRDSQLTAVPGAVNGMRDIDEHDDIEDENSTLSLSVNRSVAFEFFSLLVECLLSYLWFIFYLRLCFRPSHTASVRSITGCLPVSERVKSFRLRFFGHLARSAPEEDHHRVIAAALRPPPD